MVYYDMSHGEINFHKAFNNGYFTVGISSESGSGNSPFNQKFLWIMTDKLHQKFTFELLDEKSINYSFRGFMWEISTVNYSFSVMRVRTQIKGIKDIINVDFSKICNV